MSTPQSTPSRPEIETDSTFAAEQESIDLQDETEMFNTAIAPMLKARVEMVTFVTFRF
jgi:hypothetical protein